MEKNFMQYVDQVKGCNQLFTEAIGEKKDALNKVMIDWRYSEKGKQDKKEALYKDLRESAENMTKIFKEAVKRFLDDFRIVLPDDGKDHAKDIENGLRIVEMLGFGLDVKNLDNIMRPLRQSYPSMKIIVDVIEAKNSGSMPGLAGVGYDPIVFSKLYDYMGINSRVADYMNLYDRLTDIVNGVEKYSFQSSSYSNSTIIEISDLTPYSFLACPDWITEAGKMYAELESEFATLFVNHVPTDKEMIESVLMNQ